MSADATELVARALGRRPRGIICDIDGTLSPIAPTPDAARLAPGAAEALDRLVAAMDVVAVVSGRSAHDAQQLIGVPGVLVVGNHGLESLDGDDLVIHPEAGSAIPNVRRALERIQERVQAVPELEGVLIEDKGVTGSVHYRLAQDREYAETILNEWASEFAAELDLKITHGRQVIELRPPIAINKGVAVRRIVDEYHLEGALFFGDDVTDIDGFRAFQALRADRGIETWAIGVADPEAKPEVIEAADAAVGGVLECVALLSEIASQLHLTTERGT